MTAWCSWDGRCTRCGTRCTTGGCPNANCEASLLAVRVFVVPVVPVGTVVPVAQPHVLVVPPGGS